jgi:hypothetical protein
MQSLNIIDASDHGRKTTLPVRTRHEYIVVISISTTDDQFELEIHLKSKSRVLLGAASALRLQDKSRLWGKNDC